MNYYNLPSDKTFLVSTKAIITDKNKILILKSSINKFNNKLHWELPGGIIDIGESPEDSLCREILEETGLTIKILNSLTIWSHEIPKFVFADGRILDVWMTNLAFIAEKISGNVIISDEHQQYSWVKKNELLNFNFAPNCAVAVNKYLSS